MKLISYFITEVQHVAYVAGNGMTLKVIKTVKRDLADLCIITD